MPLGKAFCLLVLAGTQASEALAVDNGCLACHPGSRSGYSASHGFGAADCTPCHGGQPKQPSQEHAHDGLIAYPGELAEAPNTCGRCHPGQVDTVSASLMHTGAGMVQVTRRALGDREGVAGTLQTLGQGPADSLLRKMCASCHLGQARQAHRHDVMFDRGGGCSACHLGDFTAGGHPALTRRVSDARCFGCHARSGRISLSYTGLAETLPGPGPRLPDGRSLERRPADTHYLAGMGCIDCHTGVGLMGGIAAAGHQREAVDIACRDCHTRDQPRISLRDWPARHLWMKALLPFPATETQQILLTGRKATPLWHIELRDNDAATLHLKSGQGSALIPEASEPSHPLSREHERLSCTACHSQWAPQCFGCHLQYQPGEEQWDHLAQAMTPGRWRERRWDVRNTLPVLGVSAEGVIEPFVPGMIMTVEHPDLEKPRFLRMFGALSPHTTGRSRSCASCHRNPFALGLGEGTLEKHGGTWRFEPSHDLLEDGLAADAWTSLDGSLRGTSAQTGQRPLSAEEIRRVLDTRLP